MGSVFSFRHVGSEDPAQVISLVSKCLYPLEVSCWSVEGRILLFVCFYFFFDLLVFNVSECFAFMCVCAPLANLVSLEVRRGNQIS